jgi:DNA-binding IscR family transcriptional regulator
MFSKATEYALRATIYLAQKSSPENKLGLEDISMAIDSPKSFTYRKFGKRADGRLLPFG